MINQVNGSQAWRKQATEKVFIYKLVDIVSMISAFNMSQYFKYGTDKPMVCGNDGRKICSLRIDLITHARPGSVFINTSVPKLLFTPICARCPIF